MLRRYGKRNSLQSMGLLSLLIRYSYENEHTFSFVFWPLMQPFVRCEARHRAVLVNKVWLLNKVLSPGMSVREQNTHTHRDTEAGQAVLGK